MTEYDIYVELPRNASYPSSAVVVGLVEEKSPELLDRNHPRGLS